MFASKSQSPRAADLFPDDEEGTPQPSDPRTRREEVIGEVIESSTTRFVARCPRPYLNAPPDFGAFVKVLPPGAVPEPNDAKITPTRPFDDPFADPAPPAPAVLPPDTPEETLYAVVCLATTGSAEPGRHPAAYGLDEASLHAEQPQIFDLLATDFVAIPIGFARGGRVRLSLPARPPRLHAFVRPCTPEEVCALTDALDFLRTLLAAPGEVSADELIAACLRQAYLSRQQDFAFLVRAGKHLANLLRDDPERLAALLRKLEP